MMGFVKDKPVRSPDPSTHCLQIEEEFREEMGTIKQPNTKKINVYVHIWVLEYSKDFIDTRHAPLITDCHETRISNIITLRIHGADLIGLLNETFYETGRQRRLPATRRPRDQNVGAIRWNSNNCAVEPCAEQDVTMY